MCRARARNNRQQHAEECISAPMKVQVLEQLGGSDQATSAPIWASFCGVSNGAWQGTQTAFAPGTGEPEALWQDAQRRAVTELATYTVEERREDGEAILRRSVKGATVDALREAASAAGGDGGAAAGGDGAAPAWAEDEQICEDEPGLVFFDDGTFSRGPARLLAAGDAALAAAAAAQRAALERQIGLPLDSSTGIAGGAAGAVGLAPEEHSAAEEGWEPGADAGPGVEADDGDEDPEGERIAAEADIGKPPERQTVVVEQCCAWGGEQRLRLRLTLCVGADDAELDVEVLRIALFREGWQCLAEADADACILPDPGREPAEAGAGRLRPDSLGGEWKVLDVTGVPIVEEDALTGEPRQLLAYCNRETRQRWRRGGREPSAGGLALWLPGGVALELRMVPAVSRGAAADAQEGVDLQHAGRGLVVALSWLVRDGTLIGVEREYDACGELLEVRSRTAVRGGWVGGRM